MHNKYNFKAAVCIRTPDFSFMALSTHSKGAYMRVANEFKIRNAAGHEVILQDITSGISYLDFGNTHLPRDFQGYRVKYTDRTAQPQEDGSFRISNSDDVYQRM